MPYINIQGQNLSEGSSSSYDAEMSRAVTSYSSSARNMSSNLITKTTTSYIPIRSTRINSDIIHAYMARNDVYNWPGWLLHWADFGLSLHGLPWSGVPCCKCDPLCEPLEGTDRWRSQTFLAIEFLELS